MIRVQDFKVEKKGGADIKWVFKRFGDVNSRQVKAKRPERV